MEKLKFKTAGQFLVALEEAPLYCNKNCKFTLDIAENIVEAENLNSSNKVSYGALVALKGFAKEREFTRKRLPQDKDLVICCTAKNRFEKVICFYDAKNSATFRSADGSRDGFCFSNYEVIPKNPETGLWDAPFDWANDALKKLED